MSSPLTWRTSLSSRLDVLEQSRGRLGHFTRIGNKNRTDGTYAYGTIYRERVGETYIYKFLVHSIIVDRHGKTSDHLRTDDAYAPLSIYGNNWARRANADHDHDDADDAMLMDELFGYPPGTTGQVAESFGGAYVTLDCMDIRAQIPDGLGERGAARPVDAGGWVMNPTLNREVLSAGRTPIFFCYFPKRSAKVPGVLLPADDVVGVLRDFVVSFGKAKTGWSQRKLMLAVKIARTCLPIAAAAVYGGAVARWNHVINIGARRGVLSPTALGAALHKDPKKQILEEIAQAKTEGTPELSAPYTPMGAGTDDAQCYPGESHIIIDFTKTPPRPHVPGALPPRPPLAALPLASDLAGIVLESGKFFRVGDVRLPLTVESISVKERQSIDTVPLLRNRGTMKRTVGHTATRVDVSVVYRGPDEINGCTIDGDGHILEDPITKARPILSGIYFEHFGLRPLIATFRRAPFVPVINAELNERYGITALAFAGVQIVTEDGAPGVLRVVLSFFEFDHQLYLPTVQQFSDAINWPLYQKYVYDGLCAPSARGLLPRTDKQYVMAHAIPLAAHEASPPDMRGHMAPDVQRGVDTARETGLWDDELLDEAVGLYKILPRTFNLSYSAEPPKLKPLPHLELDASTGTLARNGRLHGGVRFHVADEAVLRAIRETNIRNEQQYQRKQARIEKARDAAKRAGTAIAALDTQRDALASYLAQVSELAQTLPARTATPSVAPLLSDIAPAVRLPIAPEISQVGARTYSTDLSGDDQMRRAFLAVAAYLTEQDLTKALKRFSGKTQASASDVERALRSGAAHTHAAVARELLTAVETKRQALTQRQDALQESATKLNQEMAQLLQAIKQSEQAELSFVSVELPGDAILGGVEVVMTNNFAQLPLESREQPALQYLGGADTLVRLNFHCQDETVQALQTLKEHVQYLSREYRWATGHREHGHLTGTNWEIKDNSDRFVGQQLESAFLLLDQELANLCGIESVLITDIDFDNVPEAPGWYTLTLGLLDFDRTQKKHETLNKVVGTAVMHSTGTALAYEDAYADGDGVAQHQASLLRGDEFHKRLYELELYPDLELPTYATVNAWIVELYDQAKQLGYPQLMRAGFLSPPEHDPRLLERIHVDPDFFITTDVPTAADLLADVLIQESEQRVDLSDEQGSGTVAHAIGNRRDPRESTNPHAAKQGARLDDAVVDFGRDGSTIETNLQSAEQALSASRRTCGEDQIITARSGKRHETPIDVRNQRMTTKAADGTDAPMPDLWYVNRGVDIFAEHPGAQDKQRCRPGGMNGGAEFKEAPLFAHFADSYLHGKQGRLIRAFPAFWITLIDAGRIMNQLVLNDNFYGVNGLSSLTIVKHRAEAANLCELVVSNVYGNLTNITAQRALDEGVRRQGWSQVSYYLKNIFERHPDAADITRREQEVAGLFLQAGARLHVRLGYGNCPHALPVVFNGTITEVPGGEGEVRIIAMGDGMELLNDVQGEPNQKLGGLVHGSEPQDIMAPMLGARGGLPPQLAGGVLKRVGNWFQRMVYQTFPGFEPDNPLGITHFGNPFYRIGGEMWGECMQNLYRSNDRGARPGHTQHYDENDDAPLDRQVPEMLRYKRFGLEWKSAEAMSEWLAFLETFSFGQKEFSTDLFGKTAWDLCVLSSQVAPDYIVSVVPFQFRSSLFYGKPYYSYCYDYDLGLLRAPCLVTTANGPKIRWIPYGAHQSHWQQYDFTGGADAVHGAISQRVGWQAAIGMALGAAVAGVGAPALAAGIAGGAGTIGAMVGLTDDIVKHRLRYCIPKRDPQLRDLLMALKVTRTPQETDVHIMKRFVAAQLRKPFQQVYAISSCDDIIANSITASSENVYTVVRGTYKAKHWKLTVPFVGSFNPFAGPDDPKERGVSVNMTLPVYADYTIFPEHKRAITVDTQIYIGRFDMLAVPFTNRDPHGNLPNNVATTILKNYIAYMYKGQVSLLGLASIKPYDVLVLDDTYNELHGPVGVREVVHQLNAETGFTTTVEPDALVAMGDQRLLRNWSLFRTIGGTTAFQRAALGEGLKRPEARRSENLARQLRQIFDLSDLYLAGNTRALRAPAVRSAYTALATARADYEALLGVLDAGTVDEAAYSEEARRARTGAYRYLAVPHFRGEIAIQRRHQQVLGGGAVMQSHFADSLAAVDPPVYRTPQDIGGPAPFHILALASAMTGDSEAAMDTDSLLGRAVTLMQLANVEAIIIERALDQLQLQDNAEYTRVMNQQRQFLHEQTSSCAQRLSTIKAWFSPDAFNTQYRAFSAAAARYAEFDGLRRQPEIYAHVLTAVTLAKLLVDAKADPESVTLAPAARADVVERAYTELGEAYAFFLAAAAQQDPASAQTTQFIVDYLLAQHAHLIHETGRTAIQHVRASSAAMLVSGMTRNVLTQGLSQILLGKGLAQIILRSPIVYKVLYSTFSVRDFIHEKKLAVLMQLQRWGAQPQNAETAAKLATAAARAQQALDDAQDLAIVTRAKGFWDDVIVGEKGLWTALKQVTQVGRERALTSLRTFMMLDDGADVGAAVKSTAAGARSLKQFFAGLGAARAGAAATAGAEVALTAAKTTNPVGWVMLAIEGLCTLTVGNLINMLNRYLANLHAVQIMTLRKHGAEFSAGINGHQGLVYGDQLHKMQRIFNHLSGKDTSHQAKLWGWDGTALATVTGALGMAFPYCPEMTAEEQQRYRSTDDLFNPRAFGERSIAVLQARQRLGALGQFLGLLELDAAQAPAASTPTPTAAATPAPTPLAPFPDAALRPAAVRAVISGDTLELVGPVTLATAGAPTVLVAAGQTATLALLDIEAPSLQAPYPNDGGNEKAFAVSAQAALRTVLKTATALTLTVNPEHVTDAHGRVQGYLAVEKTSGDVVDLATYLVETGFVRVAPRTAASDPERRAALTAAQLRAQASGRRGIWHRQVNAATRDTKWFGKWKI